MKIYIVERVRRFDINMFESESTTEVIKYFSSKQSAINYIEQVVDSTDYDYVNDSYFWFERELED